MKKSLFLFVCILSIAAHAQTFVLDETFNQGGAGFTGYGKVINESLIQPDGKILIVGYGLNNYNGIQSSNVLRLNADGSIDPTFILPTGVNGSVHAVTLDSQGNIYVGGSFTSFNGATKTGIVRLFSNGTLDNSFTVSFPSVGINHTVYDIDLDENGNVYIAGDFFVGVPTYGRRSFARLTNTGELNMPPATVNIGENSNASTVEVRPDGKIYLSGFWFGGFPSSYGFIRLNADCTLDAEFNSQCTIGGTASTMFFQPDDKILLGGLINLEFGGGNYTLARINPDGSLDESFIPHAAAFNSSASNVVSSIVPYQNGFLTSGTIPIGSFWYTPGLARIEHNGASNPDFSVQDGFSGTSVPTITDVHVVDGGKILATGNFTGFNGTSKVAILRLMPVLLSTVAPVSSFPVYYNREIGAVVSRNSLIQSVSIFDVSSREISKIIGVNNLECFLNDLPGGQMLIAVVNTDGGTHKLKIVK